MYHNGSVPCNPSHKMTTTNPKADVRFIPLSYNVTESQTSALRLILTLFPEWEHTDGKIEFVRFTDGITNTLLKAINKRPGLTDEQIDSEAVLLRAYGKGTDLIIDRQRETQNHELLMQYGLAPALLARFQNGMLYKFIRGGVTSPADLRREDIWCAVARRLAQWHAVVPCLPASCAPIQEEIAGSEDFGISPPTSSKKDPALQAAIDNVAPGKLTPNVWTVMQKWIYALPTTTDAERKRQATLQKELLRIVEEFSNRPGLGENGVCIPSIICNYFSDSHSLFSLTAIFSVAMSSFNPAPQTTRHPTKLSRSLTTNMQPHPQLPSILQTTLQNGAVSTAISTAYQRALSALISYVNTYAATSRISASIPPKKPLRLKHRSFLPRWIYSAACQASTGVSGV